ncbi:MAG: hypothetical protein HY662_01800 [Chloroflexi bacterium]|nr:hypothetical protein [Chloroflexota bacterium]
MSRAVQMNRARRNGLIVRYCQGYYGSDGGAEQWWERDTGSPVPGRPCMTQLVNRVLCCGTGLLRSQYHRRLAVQLAGVVLILLAVG